MLKSNKIVKIEYAVIKIMRYNSVNVFYIKNHVIYFAFISRFCIKIYSLFWNWYRVKNLNIGVLRFRFFLCMDFELLFFH